MHTPIKIHTDKIREIIGPGGKVIRQIQAVQSALNKVGKIILDEHLHSCVITAVQGEDPAERRP